MKTATAIIIALSTAIACGGPSVSPGGTCEQVCAPYGVCEYQGGSEGANGTCVCKDKYGKCPGESDAGGQ